MADLTKGYYLSYSGDIRRGRTDRTIGQHETEQLS